MAYVEVKAKTVELAVEAAMRELNVTDRGRLDVKVLQEPERGFLGFGGQDAIVRVEEKRGEGRQKRRSRGGRTRQEGKAKPANTPRGNSTPGGESRNAGAPERRGGGSGGGRQGQGGQGGRGNRSDRPARPPHTDDRDPLSTETQEPLVKAFLTGLVESFGLEGEVETRIDEDVIVANVVGDQTQALVGPRGSVMEAVHELTKTVLQRTAQDSARVRIDIAGYAERRRQALTIYAGDLIEQVVADGGEIMLDPMSAADRKVIHDAVAARPGVRSYSEGESPERYVVIATVSGADDEEE
ncbi:MAG TPA: RNA-binding cell elongation regulator Jag/EloR [Acidimicrobiia bacterium]|nr:RNA-binding cell elongation regulator Jag/EloR [Acidimicrobiia bacterium]